MSCCVPLLLLRKICWRPNLLPTAECDLTWRQGLYKNNEVKIRLLVWALIQYDWGPPVKGKFRHRCTQGECDVNMKTEMMVTLLEANEPQRLPANHQKRGERRGTGPSLKALRRNQHCQHLDLGRLACRAVRQYISAV